jgi:hypothetical protein
MSEKSSQLYGTVPTGVVSPLATLNQEQKEKMEKLRSIVNEWGSVEDPSQVNDLALYRYLKGLGWDIDIAAKHLKETLEWRSTFRPQDLELRDFERVAKSGWCYHYGFDRESRPVIYMKLGRDSAPDSEENRMLKYKFLAYVQEKCVSRMPENVINITWVVDLDGASITMSLIKSMKDMFVKLGDHYTERLAKVYVMNLGWGLSMIWSFMKHFLAQTTVDKYNILSGGEKTIKAELSKAIDPSQLPKDFFGDLDHNFKFDTIVAEEESTAMNKALKGETDIAIM